MKRSDDNRISQIKIPDAAVAIAAAAAQNSSNTGAGTIATPIFPQRQLDMPQQPINATSATGATGVPGAGMSQVTLSNTVSQPPSGGGQQQQVSLAAAAQLSSAGGQLPVGAANAVPIQGATFQRIQSSSTSGHASVSVFRSDGSVSVQPASVASQQQPPQAHSNIAMTPAPARSSTQPAPPAHITQTPVTQPAGNIKPEPIALPTTPVSVQYTTTTFPGAAHAGGSVHPPTLVPPSVKTLATGQGTSSTQNIVNLTSQASITAQPAHQQIIHPKGAHGVTFGPPSGIRTITTGNLPTTGNVSSSSIIGGTPATPAGGNANIGNGPQGNAQFQRLKVEDALSYLDQVKFKFGNQPQVYNDFLDIMKEFKTQSIDTPGVIARVSCLFKGHPELIVGFNTFLPPGYKIEVTSMNTVGVTGIPGTTGMQTIVHTPHGIHTMGAQGNMSVISTPSSESITGAISVTTGSAQQSHPPQSTRQTTAVPSLTSGLPINNKYQAPAQQQSQAAHQHQNIIKSDSTSVLPNNTSQQTNNQFPSSHQINQSSSNHPSALTVTHHPAQRGEHVTVLSSGSATNIQQHTLNLTQPSSNQITSHQLPPTAHHPIPSHITNLSQGPPMQGGNSQPEFNHAINYVNKIKNRFQGQPEVYKQFLEILHTYQKDQKAIKEGNPPVGRHLTETEVYAQVSKLFQNQEDLLNEFGQFLPEATNDHATSVVKTGLTNDHISVTKKPAAVANTYKYPKYPTGSQNLGNQANNIPGMATVATKRPPSGIPQPPPKKPKFPGSLRDVSLAEAGKFGTLNEYAFFDKVRKALRSPEVYENFLRCLVLFNQEVISRTELVQLTSTFLNRYPELFKWFKDFVGYKDGPHQNSGNNEIGRSSLVESGLPEMRTGNSGIPSIRAGDRGLSGEKAMEIDYATCKRLGKSYCAYPKDFRQPICTGRTELCKQVLNDNWVSFPTWSEDSQFVTQRKTQFEEFVYRTEDERFEFDIVLETNKDTIKVLECVQKKMSRMPPEEAARYRLDDCLGGTSQTIHQRAIRRIYGDKSVDIIEGLKRNPVVAVPLVLRRLRAKDEEWREVQKNFNKVWRDQNEKHYLKSLDHQCMQFKQSDTRNLRSKSLLNEIETLYDERHEQEEAINNSVNGERQNIVPEGPHMTIEYQDPSILDDANNLLIHHVKRQTSIHKEDKQKIKLLLRHFLMDTFKHPRQDLSEDEREDEEDSSNKEDNESDTGNNVTGNIVLNNGGNSNVNVNSNMCGTGSTNRDAGPNTKGTRSERVRKKKEEKREKDKQSEEKSKKDKDKCNKEDILETDIKLEQRDGRRTPLHARDMEPDESYMHMVCNNNWYLFFRLHHILCERLTKMYNQAVIIASEESKDKKDRKECTAVALRLKPKNEIEPEDYYPAYIDMVKNLLDGNMDAQSYEDTLREMFGIHAYISFTLDKVVGNAVRQLQHLVTDEAAIECYEMFLTESKNKATGGFCSQAHERQIAEMVYQKKCEKLLADENCMKIFVYHQSCKLSIEMLDTETDGQNSDDEKEDTARKYASYVDRFIQPDESISMECKEHLMAKPVFLPRSVRSYNLSPYGKARSAEAQQSIKSTDLENPVEVKQNSDTNIKDQVANEKSNMNKSDESKSNHGVYNNENTQVTFNPKNFKILYVINSENCFYRKLALTRAKHSHKAVSRRKTSDFNRWHSKWVKEHVSEVQESSITEWFMGKCDGLVKNKTQKVVKSDQDRTPYRTYYKFKAEIIKE